MKSDQKNRNKPSSSSTSHHLQEESKPSNILVKCSQLERTGRKDFQSYTIKVPLNCAGLTICVKRRNAKDCFLNCIFGKSEVLCNTEDQVVVQN